MCIRGFVHNSFIRLYSFDNSTTSLNFSVKEGSLQQIDLIVPQVVVQEILKNYLIPFVKLYQVLIHFL